jgi:hypothetical protein
MQFNHHASLGNVANERAYLVSMNAKETALESIRQGAIKGFDSYYSSHYLEMCIHCPPCHPKLCNPLKCQSCFRESEAMDSAKQSALLQFNLLEKHDFDSDFTVSIGSASIQAFSRAEPLSRNGFALDSVRINNDIEIGVSSDKFATDGKSRIPGGLIVDANYD